MNYLKLTPYAAILALLGALWYTHSNLQDERLAHAATKAEHALQMAEEQAARLGLSEGFRAAEQALQAQINTTRKDANEKIAAARATADDLRSRLRKLTKTPYSLVPPPSGLAGDSAAAGIGDGSVVLGTLGEEDVSEAERAEVIRLELLACYASYDAARAARTITAQPTAHLPPADGH